MFISIIKCQAFKGITQLFICTYCLPTTINYYVLRLKIKFNT